MYMYSRVYCTYVYVHVYVYVYVYVYVTYVYIHICTHQTARSNCYIRDRLTAQLLLKPRAPWYTLGWPMSRVTKGTTLKGSASNSPGLFVPVCALSLPLCRSAQGKARYYFLCLALIYTPNSKALITRTPKMRTPEIWKHAV